jgi:hypothetical protein
MKKLYLLFLFIFILTCKEHKNFTANVEIVRLETVKIDSEGKPFIVDLEISYIECPGTQLEIIRGDKKFATCLLGQFKVGDKVNVDIEWKWDTFGYYKWSVNKVANCERVFDPLDEVSYDLVEECEDYLVYNNNVGFTCRRIPTSKLIAKCPWFRKK